MCTMDAFSLYSAAMIKTQATVFVGMLWFREGSSLSKTFSAQMLLPVFVLLHRLYLSCLEEIKKKKHKHFKAVCLYRYLPVVPHPEEWNVYLLLAISLLGLNRKPTLNLSENIS